MSEALYVAALLIVGLLALAGIGAALGLFEWAVNRKRRKR